MDEVSATGSHQTLDGDFVVHIRMYAFMNALLVFDAISGMRV